MFTLEELEIIELGLYRLKECDDKRDLESQNEIDKVLNKVIKGYMDSYNRLHD